VKKETLNSAKRKNEDKTLGYIKQFTKEGKIVYYHDSNSIQKEFKVDACLGPDISQEKLYEEHISNLVGDVIKGFDGTVIAFGSSNSGKTFSLRGSPDSSSGSEGIILRALQQLFKKQDRGKDINPTKYFISYYEVYCQTLRDLLVSDLTNEDSKGLTVRERNGDTIIENLKHVQVSSPIECFKLMKLGDEQRANNIKSARSHVIMKVTIEKKNLDCSKYSKEDKDISTLTFIDLAGSERVKKSGAQYQKFDEAKAINLSLSSLSTCITALSSSNRELVPYRESKLTRILKPSLSGKNKTAFIVCLHQEEDEEKDTYRSLMFAHTAAKVRMKSKEHCTINFEKAYLELQEELINYDDEHRFVKISNKNLRKELEESIKKRKDLEEQVRSLTQKSRKNAIHELILNVNKKASETGSDDAIAELDLKWKNELLRVQNDHVEEIQDLHSKYEERISAYKNSASNATHCIQNLENELEDTKKEYLSSMKKTRSSKVMLKEMELSSSKEIEKLKNELRFCKNEKENIIAEHAQRENKKNEMKNNTSQCGQSKAKTKTTEFSSDIIIDMEKTFNDTIRKLSKRIENLEEPINVMVSFFFCTLLCKASSNESYFLFIRHGKEE